MSQDIQSKVLIVKPTISQVGKSRTDKEITSEVHEQHSMDASAGQYVKKLWPEQYLKGFTKIVGEAYRFHKRNTVVSQFGDLLPTIRFEQYKEKMDAFIASFDQEAEDFCARYDEIIAKAREIHNGTFKLEFYPAKEAVRNEFSFTIFTAPVPRVKDLAVSYLDDERISQIRQEIESSVTNAGREASRQVMQRVLECVSHICVKLSEPEAVFRNSLIDNLKEVLKIAPALNISDDPTVSQLIAECSTKLVKDPDLLRNNNFQRSTTALFAKQISDSFGKMGGRKLAA